MNKRKIVETTLLIFCCCGFVWVVWDQLAKYLARAMTTSTEFKVKINTI